MLSLIFSNNFPQLPTCFPIRSYRRTCNPATKIPASATQPPTLVVIPAPLSLELEEELELEPLHKDPFWLSSMRTRGSPLEMVTARFPEPSVVKDSQVRASMTLVEAAQPEEEESTETETLEAEEPPLEKTEIRGFLATRRVVSEG